MNAFAASVPYLPDMGPGLARAGSGPGLAPARVAAFGPKLSWPVLGEDIFSAKGPGEMA